MLTFNLIVHFCVEQTRVPLLIASPRSPFPGQHYPHVVEHIDLLPTIIDLLELPTNRVCTKNFFKGVETLCLPLQGKSLARVVLGDTHTQLEGVGGSRKQIASDVSFPLHKFAIQQKLSCLLRGSPHWVPCLPTSSMKAKVKFAVSGYSLRDANFRYTIWIPFNLETWSLKINDTVFYEELYDHRNETLSSYTHLETKNIIKLKAFQEQALYYKNFLLSYIKHNITFVSQSTKRNVLKVLTS
jgi:hypothetical protein